MFEVSSEYMENRPFFSKLMSTAVQAENSLDNATEADIKRLWVDELVPDRLIALVYHTTTQAVRNKRREYGINHKSCVQSYLERAVVVLGNKGAYIMQF